MLLLPRLWPRPLPSLRCRPVPRVFVSSAKSLLLTMGPCDESSRMPVPLRVIGDGAGEVEDRGGDAGKVVGAGGLRADRHCGVGRVGADESELVAAVHLAVEMDGVAALPGVRQQVVAAVEAEVLAPGDAQRLLEGVDVVGRSHAVMDAAAAAPDPDVARVGVGVVEGFLDAARSRAGGVAAEVAAVVRAFEGDADIRFRFHAAASCFRFTGSRANGP